MKLAIVAAGTGSRLQSEGISTPKPLIRINGTPIIDRIIKTAVDYSVDKVLCIINENSTRLNEHLMMRDYGVPVRLYVKNTESSLHSLYELRDELKNEFILSTGDTVFSRKDYENFIKYAAAHSDFDVLLSVTSEFEDEKPLCVEVDSSDMIVSFHNEKNNHKWATGGIYYFRVSISGELEAAVHSGINRLRNFFRLLLENGCRMKIYKFGKIIDVDHIQDIAAAEQLIAGSLTNDLI